MVLTSAQATTANSISLLHGDGYATGDNTRNTLRFDTTTVGEYGLIYGRADMGSFDDKNTAVNTRVIGHLGSGWHLAQQFQNTEKVSASSTGIGYDLLRTKYRVGLDVNFMSSNFYGDATHIFMFGTYNITDKLSLDGFAEYIMPLNNKDNILFTQPSIMYNIYQNTKVGMEYQIYNNKYGITGLNECVPQAKLKVEF